MIQNIKKVIKIRYASIRSIDISNGEGIGIALFVQGCKFHCYNCFNLETWDFNGGKEWTQEIKEKFIELASRPYIKRISILGGEPLAEENLDGVLDLVTEINKRYNTPQDIVSNNSKSHNILSENTDKIRLLSMQKTIWLYSGYEFDYLFGDTRLWNMLEEEQNRKRQQIISQCDVMVDGRYIDSERDITLKWRGSSNQRVINVKESLKQNKTVLYCE